MEKHKYRGIKSYAKDNVTAPRKIVRGGKVEELSYINKGEAKLLKDLGASGKRTPYGVKSYSRPETHTRPDAGIKNDLGNTSENTDAENTVGWWEALTNPDINWEDWRIANPGTGDDGTGGGGGGGGGSAPQRPVNREERIDNPEKLNLQTMYSHRDDSTAMQEYLDTFNERTGRTETNETGGTTTYIYNAANAELPDNFNTMSDDERWYKDDDGNILGWNREDGSPGFTQQNQWVFDSDEGKWAYVGEGSVEGGGGSGTTQIIGADGTAQTVGARTYAAMMGYSSDKLKAAEQQRGAQVQRLKGMAERYGGKYDDETGEFLGGGLEEKFLSQSDQYDKEVARMYGLDVQKKRTNPDGSPVLDESGQPVMETVKGDTFWKDMEDEAGRLPTDMQARLYGKRADEITAGEFDRTAQARQMMSERGISPDSPMYLRMMQSSKRETERAKRGARRESLGDAMAVQQQQMQQRLGVRTSRLAGMEQQGARMFSQGAHYGAKSQEVGGVLLEESVDRQRGQESKQLAGLQMRMAKHGAEQDRALAERIARMEAATGGGGGRNKTLGALGGAFAGGVQGWSMGGPWGAAAGAAAGLFSGLS